MSVSHSCAPSLRENAIIDSRCPWLRDVVRKMRSPQTMGDELPRPGTATFHWTPAVADHLSVYCPAGTWPCPVGPRHRDQYFAPSPVTSSIRTSAGAANTDVTAMTDSARRVQGFITAILEHRWLVSPIEAKAGRMRGSFPRD